MERKRESIRGEKATKGSPARERYSVKPFAEGAPSSAVAKSVDAGELQITVASLLH